MTLGSKVTEVTGVKKVIFISFRFFFYLLLLRLHGMVNMTHAYTQLDPTKVIGLKIHPGYLGSQIKRSFSPKMLFLLQITWYGHGTHTY